MAKIHFLNVDEGDCSIIQHDNGKVTMTLIPQHYYKIFFLST